MNPALAGLLWATAFVVLEATQFVYFGALLRRMSSFLFGFLVFGITTLLFVGWTIIRTPKQLSIAIAHPRPLLAVNICVVPAVGAYLLSVQLI